MAMHAWIIAADDSDLNKGLENPELFSTLMSNDPYYVTPFYSSLLYFLTGSAFAVDDSHDNDNIANSILRAMIYGQNSVPYAGTECGHIGVMNFENIQSLNRALNDIDDRMLKLKIASVNISENIHELIDEEELYELEVMSEDDLQKMPDILVDALADIREFYIEVEKRKQGVFMYIS